MPPGHRPIEQQLSPSLSYKTDYKLIKLWEGTWHIVSLKGIQERDQLHLGRWRVPASLDPLHHSLSCFHLGLFLHFTALWAEKCWRRKDHSLCLEFPTARSQGQAESQCNPPKAAGEALTFLLRISEDVAHSGPFTSACRLNSACFRLYLSHVSHSVLDWRGKGSGGKSQKISQRLTSIKMNFNH